MTHTNTDNIKGDCEPEDEEDDEEDEEEIKTPAEYLRDLSERLREVPVMYGIDGFDIDHLRDLANDFERLMGVSRQLVNIWMGYSTEDGNDGLDPLLEQLEVALLGNRLEGRARP